MLAVVVVVHTMEELLVRVAMVAVGQALAPTQMEQVELQIQAVAVAEPLVRLVAALQDMVAMAALA
jgi:hypothetical protein